MKFISSLILLTALCIMPIESISAQGNRTERVQFRSGATGTVVTGKLGL